MQYARILAINCGSSSIKCAVLAGNPPQRTFDFRLELTATLDIAAAVDSAMQKMHSCWPELGKIDAVVHRVVHGGERFTAATIIDSQVLAQLDELERLAPLHNPPAIRAIRAARELFAGIPHIAIFDTAFHATLPARAREYALPEDVRSRFGIRRYGFHGISHRHAASSVAAFLKKDVRKLRVVSCHLGSGASIAAIEYGRSVETSMGMTPLEGLVMGTRAGDLDPGVLLELGRELAPEALAELLNKRSGLAGLTGTGDMRDVERRAGEGDEACRLAIGLYSHRIRKYIGAYACIMGGVDAIAFTGGVGEHSALVRHRCLQRLGFLGAELDEACNRGASPNAEHAVRDVASATSRVRLLVVRADEEAAMAADAAALLASLHRPSATLRIPIAISARHAHLRQSTIEQLFGAGYQLRPKAALSQTGQFSAQETVRVIGPRGAIDHVRLLGPPRGDDQVEISRSDEFTLGIDAPVRISGDIANTPGATLEGPQGRVTLGSGVICARRHIHMSTPDAQLLGIADCDTVSVRIDSQGRDLTFSDVSVRVAPQFTLELHLDTDEANSAEVRNGDFALLLRPSDGTSACPAPRGDDQHA